MKRLSLALVTLLGACLDTSPIAYNTYAVESILTPVDDVSGRQAGASGKKVYIGHSLPVNLTITADYDEDDVPLQLYLLSVDDVAAVEAGIGGADDIRLYYCYQTPFTRIQHLRAGTHGYGVVIDVPVEQSKDELTGDYKTGTYYVLAEVDANDQAEIDAYVVYQKFKGRLDQGNTVFVAADFMKKPDLSIAGMDFTGTTDAPADSITFYQLDMSKLPGAQASNLPSFYIKPSKADRMFAGTVDVRSSSADTLNVPIRFFIEDPSGSFSLPLEIYDNALGGFLSEYYIPLLKKNTVESLTLQFRVPDDRDGHYFSTYGSDRWDQAAWEAEDQSQYPLFRIFYAMLQQGAITQPWVDENVSVNAITTNGTPAREYPFHLRAVVNGDGKVTESRFVAPSDGNSEATTDSYYEDGDQFDANHPTPQITLANNSMTEDINLRLEKIYVEPNEGAKFYPCSKLDVDNDGDIDGDDCDPDLDYRQMVIFWGGWGAHIGNNNLGAGLDVWTGVFFRNYSLFSMGFNLYGHVSDFITGGDLVSAQGGYRMSFMAESHPFDADATFHELVVIGSYLPLGNFIWPGGEFEWGGDEWWQGSVNMFTFKDEAEGFGENEVTTPITFSKFEISLDTTVAGIGIEFTLKGGFGGIYILPRIKSELVRDGSLRFEVGAAVASGVEATLELTALELFSAGMEGFIDIVTVDFGFGVLTRVYYNEELAPGKAKGTIGFGPSVWLTGPQGKLVAYVELPLLFAKVRLEQTIASFHAFKVKLYDDPFVESDKTGWVDLERPELVDYNWDELRIEE